MRLKNKSTLRHCAAVKKGGLMLEMIMKLNIPLYVMTSMGCIGGLGMLATNLTYRRMIRNTQRLQNLKEKWLNLWKDVYKRQVHHTLGSVHVSNGSTGCSCSQSSAAGIGKKI